METTHTVLLVGGTGRTGGRVLAQLLERPRRCASSSLGSVSVHEPEKTEKAHDAGPPLREGDITDYRLHDELVSSIFHPGETNMVNVAHFMCELTCDDDTWTRWRGRMPVIVNAPAAQ